MALPVKDLLLVHDMAHFIYNNGEGARKVQQDVLGCVCKQTVNERWNKRMKTTSERLPSTVCDYRINFSISIVSPKNVIIAN